MNEEKELFFLDPEYQELLDKEIDRDWLKNFNFSSIGDSSKRKEFWDFLNSQQVGYNLPWDSLRNDFLITKHELTLVSGYTGEGKSDFVNHILLDAIKQGAKGLIASLELTPNELKKRILRQTIGFTNPTYEYLDSIWNYYEDKLVFKDTRGVADIDEILYGCEMLHKFRGFDVFVFDNLMMLNSKTDDYNKQFETARKISEFSKKYPVSVFLVAHSKKPHNAFGKPATSIEPPSIYDVHGASSVANLVDNHISVAQNMLKYMALSKQKRNEPLTENEISVLTQGDAIIKRDKKREQGVRFKRHLYFDHKFCRLKDYESQILKPYV
jgi:twinkle protein